MSKTCLQHEGRGPRKFPLAFDRSLLRAGAFKDGIAGVEAGVGPGLRRDDVGGGRADCLNSSVTPTKVGAHASLHLRYLKASCAAQGVGCERGKPARSASEEAS